MRMLDISAPGITGDIRLSGGRRTSLDLQIRHWDSARKSASQIGTWSPQLGINITSSNTLEVNHKGQGTLFLICINGLKRPEMQRNFSLGEGERSGEVRGVMGVSPPLGTKLQKMEKSIFFCFFTPSLGGCRF